MEDTSFVNCRFVNNQALSIVLSHCNNISYVTCVIADNELSPYESPVIFKTLDACGTITARQCTIKDNESECISTTNDVIIIKKTKRRS